MSIKSPRQVPFRPFGDLVRDQALARPAAIVVRQDARAVTWLQFDTMADSVAATLQRAGVDPRQSISISGRNSLGYAALFVGALRAGICVAPLPSGAAPQQLARVVSDSGALDSFRD